MVAWMSWSTLRSEPGTSAPPRRLPNALRTRASRPVRGKAGDRMDRMGEDDSGGSGVGLASSLKAKGERAAPGRHRPPGAVPLFSSGRWRERPCRRPSHLRHPVHPVHLVFLPFPGPVAMLGAAMARSSSHLAGDPPPNPCRDPRMPLIPDEPRTSLGRLHGDPVVIL